MGTTVDPVVDGMMRLFPAVLFPDVTDAEWDRHPELLDADGMVGLPYGAFVVRAPDHRVVLLDAGGGPGFVVPEHAGTLADGGRLLENLGRLGLRPSDVTDVVLSHLHVDHIGWASVDGSPAFPSATYHCHAADLAHFLPAAGPPPDDRVPPLLAPVADRTHGWDGADTTVAGIRLLHTPGHTPGSSVALVGRPGNGLAVVGDLVHCPVEFEEDWTAGTDVDPDLARTHRHGLASRLLQDGTAVTGPHFPGLAVGTLGRTEDRIRWSPAPRDACHTPHF